jgi:hypothetical protein
MNHRLAAQRAAYYEVNDTRVLEHVRQDFVDLEARWLSSMAEASEWLRMMASGSGQLAEDILHAV